MYEDSERSVFQRILWIALWLIVIIAIAWAVVWVVFFKNKPVTTNNGTLKSQNPKTSVINPGSSAGKAPSPTSKPSTSTSNSTAPNSSSSAGADNGFSNGPSASTNSGSAPAPAASSMPAPQPSALANTGAGDVLIPFAVATMVGSTIYYVRLRKKLAR